MPGTPSRYNGYDDSNDLDKNGNEILVNDDYQNTCKYETLEEHD